MGDKASSYRQILRSSSIIGGASVINIVLGIARMKAAAIYLGPAGVGLIGLLTNLTGVATAVAGMGVGNVGVRQIAEAAGKNDGIAIAHARRALFWATIFLALLGAGVFWLLRGFFADRILQDPALANDVGWLALAVGLSIASASQNALLNGLRRIGDLSRVSVYSGMLSAAFGVVVLAIWGREGLLAFILIAPVTSFILGHWYVSRLPKVEEVSAPFSELRQQWSTLARLGFAFMLASLVTMIGQLLVRSIIQKELGLQELGYFQASWLISMTYIGFVLSAMGADYYPRLTTVINEKSSVNQLISEQTEIALILASPVLIAMIALSPWVIQLLYSTDFNQASSILRWQVLGDVLKVMSFPLAYAVLASGESRAYVLIETLAVVAFVLLTWVLVPVIGVVGAGISFIGLYTIYLPFAYLYVKRKTGYVWNKSIIRYFGCLFTSCLLLIFLTYYSINIALVFGLLLSGAFSVYGFLRLKNLVKASVIISKLINHIERLLSIIGIKANK